MTNATWESRTEFHYFADDRLSEAHVTFRNDEWTWSAYIWRNRRVAHPGLVCTGSGRADTADAARGAAEQWLQEHLPVKANGADRE